MDLEKTYDPKKYESEIYRKWEEAGAFKPSGKGEPFSIIMPPPNANGNLHAGHAVGYTLEDVITRARRMQGFNTLWLPGTDHAGIETQFVYERDVLAKDNKTRFDLGPDKFYAEVMKFTLASQENILKQMRSMGWSADWSKLKFTLDEDIVDIVYDTFIKLHQDGHIYRGNRIVNWCTRCAAAFADIELEHIEREDDMYVLDYGPLKIATTRPETIFADVAVAVNPNDKKYKDVVGKEAIVPLVERPVPIIADESVDPKSGTGALKVTPGHDPTDYEIGRRHKLPEISVIDPEGKLVNVPDEFAGLNVIEGRQKAVAALEKAGKLASRQTISHRVATHERCGTVIEPLVSEQWFLRVKDLNKPVIKALENDQVKAFPARFKKIALNWLAQEHDWCISRQIWWGIRIPVYYRTSHDQDKEPYLITKSEDEAKQHYGEGNYKAETDTFDTWFSSGQWPYATLMTNNNFKEFYPTTLMGTAREILHKWVTRMIMFSLYKTGKIPFEHIYLWGLVTDNKGQKMSKSKGNVIDPLEMTAKYGTDAFRLAGTLGNTPGTDSALSEQQIVAGRNFANKLWNVARFVLTTLGKDYPAASANPKNLYDEWMLTRLNQTIQVINEKLENYRLNEAALAAYHLLWDDFADWYVEVSKSHRNPEVLAHCFENILKLLHPFIPFVTEAIWEKLPNRKSPIITSQWPEAGKTYLVSAQAFQEVKNLITEIRTIGSELDLGKMPLYFHDSQLIAKHGEIIKKLANISDVSEVKDGRGIPLIETGANAWLGVDTQAIEDHKSSLASRLKETQGYVNSLEKKLNSEQFTKSAPKEVVEATKERQTKAKDKAEHITAQLKKLENI